MNTERDLEYWYADPTGNITLLIEGSFSPDVFPGIARLLLSAEPRAEQAGFLASLTGSTVSLRMAGDEFCGNASLSSAAVALRCSGASSGCFSVNVFGQASPLQAEVQQTGDSCYSGRIEMPAPLDIASRVFSRSGQEFLFPVVRFPGISHILSTQPLEKGFAEDAIRSWCRELDAPALGIMQLDLQTDRLLPLVYVPRLDTLYWESSCASGTCAAACWFSAANRTEGLFRFTQPGGTLGAQTDHGNLYLSGTVSLEKKRFSLPAEMPKPL